MKGEVGISVKSAAKKQPKLLRSGEIDSAMVGGGLKTANLSTAGRQGGVERGQSRGEGQRTAVSSQLKTGCRRRANLWLRPQTNFMLQCCKGRQEGQTAEDRQRGRKRRARDSQRR